ncbi:hypothetical protein [Kitasatospora camelliae]|uniref:Lipoprotein n=1 Tax=Kitasatospora camelliae TaxID=3156397 RepID=A0AAU8JW72_9ACTN
MAVRRTAAALLACLVLAGAAACGGSGDGAGSAPSSPVASSARPTPTDRSPHGVLLAAQLVAHDARRAKVRGRLGADTVRGLVFWAPKTVLQLRREGSDQQLIVLDTSAYLGGDQATADRLGGRHWEKFGGGKEIPYAALADRLNPLVALTAAAAAEAPELVGEEQLEEVTTRHYRVTVPAALYAEAQTQLTGARRQALQEALGGGQVTLDLWLNDRDQLVQLRRTARVEDTLEYADFGGPLSVQAPAEADTADAVGRGLPPQPLG